MLTTEVGIPFVPPHIRSSGGDGDGRDGGRRPRRGGGRDGADASVEVREVTCTTCLQHAPSDRTFQTERGPICEACAAEAESRRRSGPPAAVLLVGAGLVVLVALIVAVAWMSLTP